MDAPVAPTLTEKTSPGHGVEIFIASIDSDAVTATCWRVADGEREAVRGALRVSVSGDFVVTDWEVPNGVEATYVVEIFDVGGASVLGASSSITLSWDEVVLSNPIDPEQQVTIELEAAAFSQVVRPRRTEQVFVLGVRRPFEQNWGAGPIRGMPFTAWTETDEQARALAELLESSPLLLRTPPRFTTLPRLLTVSIPSPQAEPFDQRFGGTAVVWTLTVDEVHPVSKAILRPLITWDDWMLAFPTEQASWSGTAGASTSVTPALAGASVTNLVTNPSGETATTGWSAVAGTSGTAAVTNPKVTGLIRQGRRELRCTWSVASTAAGGGLKYDQAVTAGLVYSFGLGRVRASIGNRLQVSVEWRTASATISTVTATAVQVTAGTIYDEATFLLENLTAPPTATVARIGLLSVSGTGYANWSIGSCLGVKLLMVNTGATLYRPFDGDTVFGATWDDVSAVYGAGTWTDAVRNPPNA